MRVQERGFQKPDLSGNLKTRNKHTKASFPSRNLRARFNMHTEEGPGHGKPLGTKQ